MGVMVVAVGRCVFDRGVRGQECVCHGCRYWQVRVLRGVKEEGFGGEGDGVGPIFRFLCVYVRC